MRIVRLESLADLRSIITAQHEERVRRLDRARRRPPAPPPPPPPGFEPAEGVAALRALAEFTLTSHARRREAARARRAPEHGPDWGPMHSPLWQQAVREHQRLRGSDARTADDAVTLVVNHLGQLLEKAPWFTTDTRLREAAIDETLRHALPGDAVPSAPAQVAWSRYWSARTAGLGQFREPRGLDATTRAREPLLADWLNAWEAWTRRGA